MDKIEKIRQEIERRKSLLTQHRGLAYNLILETFINEYDDLLSFLDTIEESERPEPYNPVYDEAYLNEKIKKATESWKGVNVDAMLAECRGYDEEKSEEPDKSLEEEMDKFFETMSVLEHENIFEDTFKNIARHFAKWGAEHAKKDETPVPNDLEEAARDAICMAFGCDPAYYGNKAEFSVTELYQFFIAGSKWQAEKDKETIELAEDHAYFAGAVNEREQMLKGAVEGQIVSKNDGWNSIELPSTFFGDLSRNYNHGDKVRIIVLKAEEDEK